MGCSLVVCAGAIAVTQTAFAFVVMEDGRNANTWTTVVILLRCVVDILSSEQESLVDSTGFVNVYVVPCLGQELGSQSL